MVKVPHLEIALLLVGVYFLANDFHIGGLGHTTHEEQTSTNQAYFDGYG